MDVNNLELLNQLSEKLLFGTASSEEVNKFNELYKKWNATEENNLWLYPSIAFLNEDTK